MPDPNRFHEFICPRCRVEVPELEIHLCGKVLQKQRNEEVLRVLEVLVRQVKRLKKITAVGPG